MICTPGINAKMPTSRPTATPRGTERRVKRHSSGRCAKGRMNRLPSSCSRLGMFRRSHPAIREVSPLIRVPA
jgi:hypothetical protein